MLDNFDKELLNNDKISMEYSHTHTHTHVHDPRKSLVLKKNARLMSSRRRMMVFVYSMIQIITNLYAYLIIIQIIGIRIPTFNEAPSFK